MTREQQLREYDALVDAIEQSAANPTWALADWLVVNVQNVQGQRSDLPRRGGKLTLRELAERGDRSEQWLQRLRVTAERFPPGIRVEASSVRAHDEAYRQHGGAEAAREVLLRGGRLRDVAPSMESVASVQRNLAQRTPEERAAVAHALLADEATAEAVGERIVEDIPTRHNITRAIGNADERRETPPPVRPDPDRDSSEIEREFERAHFHMKAGIRRMRDVAYREVPEEVRLSGNAWMEAQGYEERFHPDHLRRVFAGIRDATDFAESMLGSGDMVSEIEEWLANVSE